MLKKIWNLIPILLIVNFLACKNEQTSVTAEPLDKVTGVDPATDTGGGNINFISKEKITLKDNSEIVFPKEDDKSSIVFYFSTPCQSKDTLTSLSDAGLAQSQQLTMMMAKAGLAIVYVDGNASMQTALGTAKANYAEFNLFKGEKSDEISKLLVQTYMGKKVMVCAAAPVVSAMLTQLTGKPAPEVPSTPNSNLYVATVKAVGDGEVKVVSY